MKIEKLNTRNLEELVTMFMEMWPELNRKEEAIYCENLIDSESETAYLALSDKKYIGFVLLSLRHEFVEGATQSPIAYVEGIYTRKKYRTSGVASKLMKQAELWGNSMGCKELASDAEIQNSISIEFHKRRGFNEVNRIVCFWKKIA